MYTWLDRREIDTHHIDLGSPWQNGYVESFNSHLRDEFLALEEFAGVLECQVLAERWRQHYNTRRPKVGCAISPPVPLTRPGASAW